VPPAAFALLLIAWALASPSYAGQPPAAESPEMALGRAALARDPAKAITYFERVETREGREWLAVALMMESRTASDSYVERAFEAAARSRLTDPTRLPHRKQIAAALHPGDLVVTFLVGESAAYAWAFDRDAFLGYQLPPPAELAVSVERARAYVDQHDADGQKRIADDLLPGLFGPAIDRLSRLQRVIVVMDGPLQRLPLQLLNANGPAIVAADYSTLEDAIARAVPDRPRAIPRRAIVMSTIAIAIAAAALASRRARRRSRAQS
jgi:hypothetical protein